MERIELKIYNAGSSTLVRAVANKWKFQDTMMGEQFITLTVVSERPIDWSVGDWCEFRGDTFTLNYVPTVTQKARSGEIGDAYTYENVKFDSPQEELTRCIMLDITPTTGDYIAALGTNYTGSSRFQLFCGETSVQINGTTATLTPVCALAAKMQANLDRMFPTLGWRILVDTESTYTTSSGKTLLVTHTDDKMLSFDNTTVAAALAEIQNTFDLNYSIKGRTIRIGYTLDYLTGETSEDAFVFGYGHGYPSADNPGLGLFQIKRIANSQQKIVTRLRAIGSTKNMPYRYYNKKYGGASNPDLSQSLFPTNLQLPGTFLPEGEESDTANAKGSTKWARNNARGGLLRAVKGDTNDAYIDKNDDAASCGEGIREDCARWDGSNGNLPEIYPTIEGVTFGDLRVALVEDQAGVTGQNAFQKSLQPDDERIDSILAVGYLDGSTLIDDANTGDGISPEKTSYNTVTRQAVIGSTKFSMLRDEYIVDAQNEGAETELFSISEVLPGSYLMAPTGASYSSVVFGFTLSGAAAANIGFIIKVKQVLPSGTTEIASYNSDLFPISDNALHEIYLPEIPDSKNAPNEKVEEIVVTERCNIVVTFIPVVSESSGRGFTLNYQVGRSRINPSEDYDPEYNWGPVDGGAPVNESFHLFVKDMGFNPSATFNGDTPVMAMKSGRCVGREFEIGDNVQRAVYNGKRGYLLTLSRAQDSSLGTYYPSAIDPIASGDHFVFLGISLPDMYIDAAEGRLLIAATDYLADNCETKFTYQPSIDEIFLQRQHDNMVKAGTPERSVFSRLYAGLKFIFHGVQASGEDPLPRIDITIEQVTITMGESLTPKVDIVLNDDIQQTTIQRLTTAVDRIYNGSAYSAGGGASLALLYELLLSEGGSMFLSKVSDDIASGKITFRDIATFIGLVKAKGGISVGEFMPGWIGNGAYIDSAGSAEFESVNVRGPMHVAELVFNMINAEDGESIRSIGHGEILTVVEDDDRYGTATLKLDGDQWATIKQGDICRGLYNTVEKVFDNSTDEGFDDNGFRKQRGFFASYFKVLAIIESSKGVCEFEYELQQGSEHPCPLMKFVVYGNTNNSLKERQSSIYSTAVGIAPRVMFLAGVNQFQIQPSNIKIAHGNIEGLQVVESITEAQYNEYLNDGSETVWTETVLDRTVYRHLKTMHGDAGFYCEDNIYLGGVIEQLKSDAMSAINSMVGNIGQAWVLANVDTIIIDCDSNGNILESAQHEIKASLYYGSNVCELVRLECSFGYGNSAVFPTLSQNNTLASHTYTFNQGAHLDSSNITIQLKGSYNGQEYNSSKTVAVIANKQGASGKEIRSVTNMYLLSASSTGVSIASDGWDDEYVEPTESYPYLWSYVHYVYTDGTTYDTVPAVLRVYVHRPIPRLTNWAPGVSYLSGKIGEQYMDIVSYMGQFYQCRQSHTSAETYSPATYALYWEPANRFGFISTDLVLTEAAVINNLVASRLQTGSEGTPHVVIEGSKVEFYGEGKLPGIVLATDRYGRAVFRFYDENGTPLYDLGPDKITQNVAQSDSSYKTVYYKQLSDNGIVTSIVNFGQNTGVVSGLTQSQCTAYYRFREGITVVGGVSRYSVSNGGYPSKWNNLVLLNNYSDSVLRNNPSGDFVIPDGWYATVDDLVQDVSTSSSTGYVTHAYNFVGGLIVRALEIHIDENDNQMYYDSQGVAHRKLGEIFNTTITPVR